MKLVSLIKIFSVSVVLAGGVTALAVFTNFNNISTPYVKVLTKSNYLKIKNTQTSQNVKNVNINYATLPTANQNLVDVLTADRLPSKAFMLSVGSYAYKTTNKMLHGKEDISSPDLENTNSLMTFLYDEFFQDKWNDLNMQFYSYIDVINTSTYFEAQELLHARKQLGDLPPKNPESLTASTQWNVLNDKGNLDIISPNAVPVVLNGDTYDLTPSTTTNYQWRPDNKYDTEYETVYFRNDDATRTFIEATTWASTYASNVLKSSLNQEGALMCAKYNDDTQLWEYLSLTSLSDFDLGGTSGGSLKKIVDFYSDNE